MPKRRPFHAIRPHSAGIALLATVLSSCGVTAQQTDLPASDRPLEPRVEDVFRVGKIDGADWEIFGERPEVAFDGAGNLHIFDPMSHRVVVVNSGGEFVRQIGRRGDGPGELRTPMGFAVMRDGTVVVADMGHAAFLVFAPDGSFQRSASFRGGDGVTVMGEVHADPRGGALLSAGSRATMIQAGSPGGLGGPRPSTRTVTRFELAEAGGSRVVFTGWEPPPAEVPQQTGNVRMRPMPRAFEPQLHVAALPDGGFVVSDSTAYELKVVSSEGRVERTLRRPLRPTPVTSQIQRAERERRLAEMDAGRGPQVQVSTLGGGPGGGAGAGAPSQAQVQQMLRQQLDQLQFYPELSVVTGLGTGWSGKIWVSRRAAGNDPNAPGPVDVLTPTGDYLGTIAANRLQVPDAFGPDGLAAWIERDQFDTPTMVVRRLPADLR
jgi:hypothetical protein